MTRAVRADNRLADMPMAPVECHRCGGQVLVRKSSWNQTSVQWNARAGASCLERAQALADQHRGLFLACSALRESIEAAVAAGRLAVVDTG